jgi:hypothetical protein
VKAAAIKHANIIPRIAIPLWHVGEAGLFYLALLV